MSRFVLLSDLIALTTWDNKIAAARRPLKGRQGTFDLQVNLKSKLSLEKVVLHYCLAVKWLEVVNAGQNLPAT